MLFSVLPLITCYQKSVRRAVKSVGDIWLLERPGLVQEVYRVPLTRQKRYHQEQVIPKTVEGWQKDRAASRRSSISAQARRTTAGPGSPGG